MGLWEWIIELVHSENSLVPVVVGLGFGCAAGLGFLLIQWYLVWLENSKTTKLKDPTLPPPKLFSILGCNRSDCLD